MLSRFLFAEIDLNFLVCLLPATRAKSDVFYDMCYNRVSSSLSNLVLFHLQFRSYMTILLSHMNDKILYLFYNIYVCIHIDCLNIHLGVHIYIAYIYTFCSPGENGEVWFRKCIGSFVSSFCECML